ncbi:MAG TPA: arginine--tRNA ligase, partial [Salinivirgaceae bacterium]|nr:arginine--tRNA ligase [Salinivirgaceae bacterium]
MQTTIEKLNSVTLETIIKLYGEVPSSLLQIQPTKKEFEGNFTLVTFPLLKFSKKSPEETGKEIGTLMFEKSGIVEKFNVIKGFLNLTLTNEFWKSQLQEIGQQPKFGFAQPNSSGKHIMIEFSSPNTNKPLHLGHIRNNLLGFSLGRILSSVGHKVTRVNLVNDRGIHICKSMVAWMKFGQNATPQTCGLKGDKLVGDFYVRFDQEYKKQVKELLDSGMNEEEAKEKAPIMEEAREMLRRWENKDPEVYRLWKT